jgi:hypothetical protein
MKHNGLYYIYNEDFIENRLRMFKSNGEKNIVI